MAVVAAAIRVLGASWGEAVLGAVGGVASSAVCGFFYRFLTWRPERRGGSGPG